MADVNGDVSLGIIERFSSGSTGHILGDEQTTSGGGGGGGVTLTYHKRARDSNAAAPPPPGSYVYWTTTDPAGAYPGAAPFGGPLVEDTVLYTTET